MTGLTEFAGKTGWFAVALSCSIEPATANGTRLFGQEVAVWRSASGMIQAAEDRCPHRGMRLSFGFVRGERLACLYHGWEFGADGVCAFIPAHPDLEVPRTITCQTYGAAEAGGLVFAALDPSPLDAPDLPGDLAPVRSVTVDCAPARLAEAFAALDPGGQVETKGALILHRLAGGLVVGGVQPLSDRQAALHVVANIADIPALARRLEALRETLEEG